jgi:alpha-glucosidase
VPLPWTPERPGFGFTTGTPWLPQPDWFSAFAASTEQDDPASVLHVYRAALRARRDVDPASPLEWIDTGRDDVLAFRRGDVVCVTVFAGAPYDVPTEWGDLVISSAPTGSTSLPADTSGWFSSRR